MKNLNYFFFLMLTISLVTTSCDIEQQDTNLEQQNTSNAVEQPDKEGFTALLEKHLRSVSERDLSTLEGTLSPKGDMLFILPQSPLRTKSSEFMDYHRAWFQDTTWSFETKILETNVEQDMGIAVVEAVYSEPERDGKPYFNRMHVSYALRKMDGNWYVVKDHASSVEKSTDIANE